MGRCIVLAEAWRRTGGDAHLVLTPAAAAHAEQMQTTAPVALIDVEPGSPEDTAATAAASKGTWLIVDGYRFDADLRSEGRRIVHLADHGHGPGGPAELVIDQNLGARASDYPGLAPSQLLLGPRYALLRSGPVEPRPLTAAPRRALVALGGDPAPDVVAHLDEAIDALVEAGLDVDVLGGGEAADRSPARPGVTIHGFVADPHALMATADIAVTPAGSTVYALCAWGIPAVVVAFHDNQVEIAAALAGAGAALRPAGLDPADTVLALARLLADGELRAATASIAARLVDGRGAERVVAELEQRDR